MGPQLVSRRLALAGAVAAAELGKKMMGMETASGLGGGVAVGEVGGQEITTTDTAAAATAGGCRVTDEVLSVEKGLQVAVHGACEWVL